MKPGSSTKSVIADDKPSVSRILVMIVLALSLVATAIVMTLPERSLNVKSVYGAF